MSHIPVMLKEVVAAMQPAKGETYVDATFGAGGYSRALLESADCRVFAIDRDPATQLLADALAREFPGRFLYLSGCFGDMVDLLAVHGVEKVNGVVMDIGVSSMQIDEASRGFSFQKDGALDMRMSSEGVSAADVVNEWEEEALAEVIYRYGEERASRRIARAIVEARAQEPIATTRQLANIIHAAMGSPSRGGIDTATRSFQALRIQVNDELGELQRALVAAEQVLTPGGRLVVVVFHSLEDRMVKEFLLSRSEDLAAKGASRHGPEVFTLPPSARPASFALPHKKPVTANREEIAVNARSRSAKLRAAIRTDAPFVREVA